MLNTVQRAASFVLGGPGNITVTRKPAVPALLEHTPSTWQPVLHGLQNRVRTRHLRVVKGRHSRQRERHEQRPGGEGLLGAFEEWGQRCWRGWEGLGHTGLLGQAGQGLNVYSCRWGAARCHGLRRLQDCGVQILGLPCCWSSPSVSLSSSSSSSSSRQASSSSCCWSSRCCSSCSWYDCSSRSESGQGGVPGEPGLGGWWAGVRALSSSWVKYCPMYCSYSSGARNRICSSLKYSPPAQRRQSGVRSLWAGPGAVCRVRVSRQTCMSMRVCV